MNMHTISTCISSVLLKKLLPVFLLLPFLSVQAQAQFSCGTDELHQHKMETSPEYRQIFLKQEEEVRALIDLKKSARIIDDNTVYTIPIVVHVVHLGEAVGSGSNISDAQIHDAVRGLNEKFRRIIGQGEDIGVEFCLATRDPQGNLTNGINRIDGRDYPRYQFGGITAQTTTSCASQAFNDESMKVLSYWPVTDYYNIWVVHDICPSGTAGYAYFPNGRPIDGTVILSTSMTYAGKTLAHEVGHAFNLYHTFEGSSGSSCAANSNCGAEGDRVCDTPPHRSSDCGTSNPCTSSGIWDNSRYNYMSYCPPVLASSRFTQGQKERIRTTLNVSPRADLLNSTGCATPEGNEIALTKIISPVYTACDKLLRPVISVKNLGSTVVRSFRTETIVNGGTSVIYQWTGTLNPGAQVDVTLSQIQVGAGDNTIYIEISNPNGQKDNFQPNNFKVTTARYQAPVDTLAIDFEGTVFPPVGVEIQNPDNLIAWEPVSVSCKGKSAYLNSFDIDASPSGTDELMILPQLDLTTYANAKLNFDVAYRRSYSNTEISLQIYLWKDCNPVPDTIYLKRGSQLATVTGYTTSGTWLPAGCNEWRKETINLDQYAGSRIRMIINGKLEAWMAQSVYIDNIYIEGQRNNSECNGVKATITAGGATTFCQGGNVRLTASQGDSYLWSTGAKTQSITVSQAGNYTVSVTKGKCTVSSPATTVVVNQKPAQPGAITGNSLVCSGITQTYSVPAVTGVTTYKWTYSGAGTVNGTSGSITLTPTGNGTLSVVATNNCGESTARTLAISISASGPPATPGTISGNASICRSVETTYSVAAVSGATSYKWTYSGTGTLTEDGRTVKLSASTAGTLSVVANNGCGVSTARTLTINLAAAPARPGVITAGENPVCGSKNVTYSVPAVEGAKSYTWTYSGGGTPSGTGNSISFRPTGSGTLSVVANNDCGTSTSRTFAVTFSQGPERPGTIAGATSVCNGATQTYQIAAVTAANNYTWTYSGGGNPSGTGTSVSLRPTSSGTLTVVANNACGTSTSRTLAITVISPPARPGVIQGSPNVCKGTSQVYFVDADNNIETYTWTYSGEATMTISGRAVTVKPVTSGTLSVIANNACGMSAARTLNITVKDGTSPQPGLIRGETTVCSGTPQTYTIDPVSGATGYLWTYGGDGTPAGSGTSISLNPTSNGNLRVVALSGCGSSNARTLAITVRPLPAKPIIDRSGDILTSSYNTDNQWYFNGKPVAGATGKTLTVTQKGKYSVEYTNANGCKGMSDVLDILSVSVDEKQIGIEAFRVYPNPNEGYFTIEVESVKGGDATLEIVNVLGQVISSQQLKNIYGKRTVPVDLRDSGKGIYFINLYYNGEIINRRVIVQ